MPASKKIKEQVLEDSSKGLKRPTAKSTSKPAGTRMGVLDDWRGGAAKGKGENSQVGSRLRDGR